MFSKLIIWLIRGIVPVIYWIFCIFILFIFAIIILYTIIYGFKNQPGVIIIVELLFLYIVVVTAIWIVGKVNFQVEAHRQRWISCVHGVPGGKMQNFCVICVDDQIKADADAKNLKEHKELQIKIQNASNELRQQELARLSKSILPSVDELRSLSPQRFEDEIARMFERLGYRVEQTPYSNDGGRDAIMWKNGEKYLLECKRYDKDGSSGREEIQKFHSAIITDDAKRGFFVTTGIFTKAAAEYASKVAIECIDKSLIAKTIFESLPDASVDDRYWSMCQHCGDVVVHQLRRPSTTLCGDGHPVEPTLNIDQLLANSSSACPKCGSPMRLINGRNGKFWGCSAYPQCRTTKSFGHARRRRP